jgi:hypothetical protein
MREIADTLGINRHYPAPLAPPRHGLRCRRIDAEISKAGDDSLAQIVGCHISYEGAPPGPACDIAESKRLP